jgi:exosome complex exonuclease DIS3/RRP44
MEENSARGFAFRNFLRKGRVLRKKCAQVKVLEKYLHDPKDQPFFFQGRSKVSVPVTADVVIPSIECLQNFLPILKQLPVPSIPNQTMLMIQTGLKVALETATAQQRREYKSLLFDFPSAARIIFLNEILFDLTSGQSSGESFPDYCERLFASACIFLADTIGCNVTVLVSDEHDPVTQSGFYPPEITISSVRSFVQGVPALVSSTTLAEVDEILDSIRLSRETFAARRGSTYSLPSGNYSDFISAVLTKQTVYRPHLSVSALRQGISAGNLIRGKFFVYRHNINEGEVEDSSYKSIIISGRKDMNRALDGDEVVVQLHPRELW